MIFPRSSYVHFVLCKINLFLILQYYINNILKIKAILKTSFQVYFGKQICYEFVSYANIYIKKMRLTVIMVYTVINLFVQL